MSEPTKTALDQLIEELFAELDKLGTAEAAAAKEAVHVVVVDRRRLGECINAVTRDLEDLRADMADVTSLRARLLSRAERRLRALKQLPAQSMPSSAELLVHLKRAPYREYELSGIWEELGHLDLLAAPISEELSFHEKCASLDAESWKVLEGKLEAAIRHGQQLVIQSKK